MITSLTNLPLIKRVVTVMVCSVIALCTASAQQREQTPKTFADLQSAIEAVLQETRTPGAGIAIVSRDKIEWVAGLGMADVARKRAATVETLFPIGSISKSFAALAALKLQEEGKLKLSDTLKQWLPEVAFENPWESTDPVRLVNLMEHTTGFDDIHLREWASNDPTPIVLKEALAYGAASRVCRWRPGTRMAYCNSGAAVLAAVIEKVSGQRFEDYVQQNFFKPLRMDTASYFLTPETEQRLSSLYHPDGVTPYPYWHFLYWPSGSLNASANDMANYVRFYLQRGSLDGVQLLQSILNESEPDVWPQLAPLLDTAMAGLGEKDRDAIVLRFFEGKRMNEVGAALGTNEEAAKKRVNRAVEKLRQFITKRGVAVPAAVLTAAISANSVQAAPVALAKTATAIALAKGATASISTLTLVKGAMKLMAWTKAKTTVVGVIVIACVLTTGTLAIHHNRASRNQVWTKTQLAVAGYATPAAALKTMLWGINNGDADAVLASMTPQEKSNAQLAFQGKFDKAVEALQSHMVDVTGFQIRVEGGSSDNVTIDLVSTNVSGQTHERKYWFKKIGKEWKCDQIHPSFDLTN